MDFTPTGAATATFGLLGQGSVRTGATSGGTPTSAAYTAFNKAQGSITRSGSERFRNCVRGIMSGAR